MVMKVKSLKAQLRGTDIEGGKLLEQNAGKDSAYGTWYRNHKDWFMCWFIPANGGPWDLYVLSPTDEFHQIKGNKIAQLEALTK